MSDHFATEAALIASLPDEDPERRAAVSHAVDCASCRSALTESAELMRLLDAARDVAELPAGALERAALAIEADLRSESRRRALWPSALVLAAFLLEVSIARHLESEPRAVGAAVFVAFVAVAAGGWHRSGLRAVLAAVTLSAGFALAMASVPLLAPAIGLKCTGLELLAASLPWIAFRQVAGATRGRWEASAVAAAGALAGHAALHLSCPVPHADTHLLVFHVGGVVLAALLGAVTTPGVPKALRGE